jgi:hypothetical protein
MPDKTVYLLCFDDTDHAYRVDVTDDDFVPVEYDIDYRGSGVGRITISEDLDGETWLFVAGSTSSPVSQRHVEFAASTTDYPLPAAGNVPTVDSADLASSVAAQLSGTSITVKSPLIVSDDDGDEITVMQGDHYAANPARIDLTTERDLTAYKFILAAELASNPAVKFSVRMTIKTDDDGQYAEFAPAGLITKSWECGIYKLRPRLELDADQFESIDRQMRLIVQPFDTSTPIVDIDPA